MYPDKQTDEWRKKWNYWKDEHVNGRRLVVSLKTPAIEAQWLIAFHGFKQLTLHKILSILLNTPYKGSCFFIYQFVVSTENWILIKYNYPANSQSQKMQNTTWKYSMFSRTQILDKDVWFYNSSFLLMKSLPHKATRNRIMWGNSARLCKILPLGICPATWMFNPTSKDCKVQVQDGMQLPLNVGIVCVDKKKLLIIKE